MHLTCSKQIAPRSVLWKFERLAIRLLESDLSSLPKNRLPLGRGVTTIQTLAGAFSDLTQVGAASSHLAGSQRLIRLGENRSIYPNCIDSIITILMTVEAVAAQFCDKAEMYLME